MIMWAMAAVKWHPHKPVIVQAAFGSSCTARRPAASFDTSQASPSEHPPGHKAKA